MRLGPADRPVWLDLWESDADGLDLDECRALTLGAALLDLSVRGGIPYAAVH